MVFQFNHKIHPKIFRLKKKNWKNFISQTKIRPIEKFPPKWGIFRPCVMPPNFSKKVSNHQKLQFQASNNQSLSKNIIFNEK